MSFLWMVMARRPEEIEDFVSEIKNSNENLLLVKELKGLKICYLNFVIISTN